MLKYAGIYQTLPNFIRIEKIVICLVYTRTKATVYPNRYWLS
jgi:hypothetical protein